MEVSPPEIFEPNARRVRRLWVAAACCWAVVIIPLLLFLTTGWIRPHAFLFMMTFAVIGTYLQHRIHRARNGAIASDDEGLWLANRSREAGLVPWDAIAFTQWSTFPGALHLRGKQGENRLTISMDLLGFGRLEERLIDETRDRPDGPAHSLPMTYTVPFPVSLWPVVAGMGLVAVLVPTEAALTIIGLPIAMLFWMSLYWQEINLQLLFDGCRIRLFRPFDPKEIAREEIDSVTIYDPYQGHLPGRTVMLNLKWGKQPVPIPNLHYEREDIKARIESWLAGDAPEVIAQANAHPLSSARS